MADIFLSYARADQPRIEQLATALEEAGYSVWWDHHIRGGHEFSRDIEEAISQASAVIVAWSKAAIESEWVREEAAYARKHGKLIPVQLDGTEPPFGYRQRQTIDLRTSTANEQLHHALDELIGGEHGAIDGVGQAATRGRKLALPMALAALALIAIFAGWYLFGRTGTTDETELAQLEERRGVIVLPFIANSSGEDDQYFADGLTEEILNRLDALRELRVVPRTTAFTYRETDKSLGAIAEEVQVEHVVEGSLRRFDDRVRVTARLVATGGGTEQTVWSEDYDASIEDVFKVQADIAEQVAASLDILLDADKRASMDDVGIDNPEAFAVFAKGNAIYSQAHRDLNHMGMFAEAVALLDRAFAMEPRLARAPLLAADFYSHILIDEAGGKIHTELPSDMREDARRKLDLRLRQARDAVKSRQERLAIELFRQAFSDDWSQIPELSDQFYAMREDCSRAVWPGFGYVAYGHAENVFDSYESKLHCGDKSRNFWRYLGAVGAVAGKDEELVEIADRARRMPVPPGHVDLLVFYAALSRGDVSTLQSTIGRNDWDEEPVLAAIYAGDGAAFDDEFYQSLPPFQTMQFLSIAGRQEEADDWAARIDAAPAGPTVLQIVVDECLCGAPFDISRTPNFRARLGELGATWPPTRPVDWPLKKRR